MKQIALIGIAAAVFLAACGGSDAELTPQTAEIKISSGGDHTCVIQEDETIKCWGADAAGQLGNGENIEVRSPVPQQVSGITTAVQVSAGSSHTCAVLQGGTISCWGSSFRGILGTGVDIDELEDSPVPLQVFGVTTAVQVSAGFSHTCAVLQGGTISCWGLNVSGELGTGDRSGLSTAPARVVGIDTAIAVSAGSHYSCAVLQEGTVMCWGENFNGQLGNGNSGRDADSFVPVQAAGVENAVSVSLGTSSACAVLGDGMVSCWGWNGNGQLGNGNSSTEAVFLMPAKVSGIDGAATVSVGRNHVCAALQDGSIRCWGRNFDGQLGNGDSGEDADSFIPVQAAGVTNAAGVSVGNNHTCALLKNQDIQCWGNNGFGQLTGEIGIGSVVPSDITDL